MIFPCLKDRSLLNRSQHSQRRFLRLGHSPDPRDSEPLVGPVAPQRAQVLAALGVPHLNDMSSPQLASLRPSGLTLSDWTAP